MGLWDCCRAEYRGGAGEILPHLFPSSRAGTARPSHLLSFEGEALARWGSTEELWMCELGLGVAVPDLCPRAVFG